MSDPCLIFQVIFKSLTTIHFSLWKKEKYFKTIAVYTYQGEIMYLPWKKRKLYTYIHVFYMVINVCYSKGNSDKLTCYFSQFSFTTLTRYYFPTFSRLFRLEGGSLVQISSLCSV